MKKIRLGHVGSLHDHSSAKLACVLKFPEIFEVVGWVPENKEREMLLCNSFPYCRVPVMTRERLLEAGVDKRVIDVYDPDLPAFLMYGPTISIHPQRLVHDVPNCGYHMIFSPEHERRKRLFYATDTATLDGVEAPEYDLYLIEANHTREELEARARAKMEKGEFAYEVRAATNHLSQEQALYWLYQQMGPNSQYVFLHQHSERSKPNAQ